MVASNVVWNLTVPDTSPMIQYRNFARKCPLNNGVLQCTTDSAHVSNSTDSSITISFYGTAIYLFGEVDSGTKYTTALDYDAAVDGAVKGKNLLASYANVPNSRAGGSLHQIVLSATRFTSNSLLTFTGAVISVDTGLASAKPVFSNYTIMDPSVSLTPGWAKDGDYMKSGTEFSQVATFKFYGSGVMVYGMCSNTQQEFSFNDFGQVKTDTTPFAKGIYDNSDSLIFNRRPYRTDDCLLYYNTGLPEGDHNLTYTSNKDNVFLGAFQVVSVNGSTAGQNGQGGGGDALGTVGKILGIGIPAVVGIVIGVIVLLLLCCIWGCCLRRRKAAARVYLPPPAPQEDPKPATESQPIIVLPVATYAPPPQPPPPTQVYVFAPDSPSETAQQWQPPAGRVEIPNSQLPRTRSRSQRYPVAGGQSYEQAAAYASGQPTRARSQSRSEAERRSTSFENAVPYDTRVALAAAAGFPPSPAVATTPAEPSHDAYAGRVVLSADGMSDQRPPKVRNEYAGSRSGPSASTAVHRHEEDRDGLQDVPPPVYEESPRPRS